MRLTLDHVPIAWHDHEAIVAAFEQASLTPEYGGVHDHAGTQMSLIGFDDQSYLELIALQDDRDQPGDAWAWGEHIAADGGPAAWCVRTTDIVAETTRIVEAGFSVEGPQTGSRQRSDGRTVEWDRTELGRPAQRLLLPFVIRDRTPLARRVPTTPSVADSPLTGVGEVVLAVPDIPAAVSTFRQLYRFPRPTTAQVPGFGRVGSVPGQPVSFATPNVDTDTDTDPGSGSDSDWLAGRLERFRPGPCACLLATPDLAAVRDMLSLQDPIDWPRGRVAFLESDRLGRWLGVIERPDQR